MGDFCGHSFIPRIRKLNKIFISTNVLNFQKVSEVSESALKINETEGKQHSFRSLQNLCIHSFYKFKLIFCTFYVT